ncbi:hypothetical protein SELMODRAFT_446942 [Selaginella moellendorffii]|uniref:ENT domain-containing protein n=1 Tax=Selaginella moellendorffii TaxID=88036 RepID=D8SVG5_SELML|nr:protein EMSY-LIKE 3 isoform X1 [Selaginella moellendorffii]EFJ11611.1 hypothetical protein SELMODRAFT_446942 [Selaginella moellendorffii]|eukprot:XP_024516880.1 protein EMSY-LIKE 3 isoform X1 [Selaginella moellendorffii]
MEMRRSDSSGTDDDLPPSLAVPRASNSRALAGNGKAGAANGGKGIDHLIRTLEQDAYTAVLRAFGAQSENISWAKERLISDLRKELRVTDAQHRDLLAKVAGDDSLRQIRDLKQSGNDQAIPSGANATASAPQQLHSSQLVPQSRKKQKTGAVSHQVAMPPAPPPPQPPPPAPAPVPKSMSKKGGAAPTRGKSKGSSDKISSQGRGPSQGKKRDALEDRWVGQFIKMRWPDDNNFYEAFVRDFHKEDGTHTLVYDMGTEKESSERVDLSKMAPEDIQSNGKHQPGKKNSSADKHQGSKKRIEKASVSFQHKSKGERKYKLPSVDSLIKQVQELEHDADPTKIEHAKRLAKEHEESLRRALEEVGETSDEESGDDRQRNESGRKNMSMAVNSDDDNDPNGDNHRD